MAAIFLQQPKLELSLLLISLPLLLHLLILGLPSGATTSAATSGLGSQPYWHRPGCYLVGHSRTISIPGCVKFNLSTNACRGFCMSFSIPAAEDIGPTLDQLDGALEPRRPEANVAGRQLLTRLLEGSINTNNQKLQKEAVGPLDSNTLDTAAASGHPSSSGGGKELERLNTFLQLSGQTKSPLAGTVGDTSDKRDVISVSHCCNMMETEDVTVNLRCGLNEIRRLVFKSAKTCECFFCKHL